ncbi:MAG: PD40 domain-containing protein [Myxococcales bacterium]|nr:PD40 domain-containing protein [Myxococcales bacterium]
MRSRWTTVLVLAATGLAVLPPLLTQAQPVPQPQQVTTQPSVGDLTITLQGLEARLLPVAIPALRGPQGDQIAAVISNDLRLSSLFRVVDPRSFTADLDAEGLNMNAGSWVSVGATAVVKGQVSGSGDALRVELKVWEPGNPAAPRLTRTYGPGNLRSLSHRIANDLIQLYTNQQGIFGTRIAFARRTGRSRKDVFTVDCDGENLSQVSSGRRLSFTPAWGPGGIYFSSQTPEGFLALFRQGASEPVLRADGLVMGAAFAGGRMAVVLTRDGNSEIYVGSSDGQNLRRLTNDPGADVSPVWSPDGSKIAFVSDRAGGPQVYVMDAGGGGQRRVSFAGSYNTNPSWAPDNSTLAYAGRAGGASDIFTVNVGSGALRRLTEGQGNNSDPTYSPDGRMIAFNSSRGGIFLMNQDGLNQQRILAGGGETLRWEPR